MTERNCPFCNHCIHSSEVGDVCQGCKTIFTTEPDAWWFVGVDQLKDA